MYFHLVVDGSCHNVAWSKAEALIVFLHELLPVRQSENASISTHGLGDEVCRMRFLRIVEHGWMELDELHVLHFSLSPVHHGDAVAGGDVRV